MQRQPIAYEDLPPECLLRVIEFLPLADVATLLRTSGLWNSIINQNENTIYFRIASTLEPAGAPPLGSLATALKSWVSPAAKKTESWKQYCRLQVITNRRWFGEGKAYQSSDFFGPTQLSEVHRLQVDTEKMLLVMTAEAEPGETASLDVHCLRSVEPIAIFSIRSIADLAHVEMSNGFIVFTCEEPDLLEVWRWAEDQAREPCDRAPSSQQIAMYEHAERDTDDRFRSDTRRGDLVPMGILKQPDQLRVLRLAFPTLCVGSHNGDRLWLWDIRSRELTQAINIEPSPYDAFNMLYVDVNETHVFVATHTVSVYSRASGNRVFQFQDPLFELLGTCLALPVRIRQPESVFQNYELQPYHAPTQFNHPFTTPFDIVMAVHVSPTGDDFVAITFRGLLIYVSGLRNAVEREQPTQSTRDHAGASSPENFKISVTQADITLENLAYDGNRILVEGTQGLSLINLENQPDTAFEVPFASTAIKLYPFPARMLSRARRFGGVGRAHPSCSCVQLTRDGFWIAWEPDLLGFKRKTVGMMDFVIEGDEDSEDGSEFDFEPDSGSSNDPDEQATESSTAQ